MKIILVLINWVNQEQICSLIKKLSVGGVVGVEEEKVNCAIKELTVERFSLYGINFKKWEYDYDTFHIL